MLQRTLRRCFGQLHNNPSITRPVQERIMSTPSWPVPYYKRQWKAAPAAEARKFKLDARSDTICDDDVVDLKYKMELNPEKFEIIRAFEDNSQTNSRAFFYSFL